MCEHGAPCGVNTNMDQALVVEPESYYQILGGQTVWLKLPLTEYSATVLRAAHTSFYKNQNWSIRIWISHVPLGASITQEPYPSNAFVNPLKTPVSFGIFDLNYPVKPQVPDLIWLHPASPENTHYVNIRNLENKPNAFYLKIDTLQL